MYLTGGCDVIGRYVRMSRIYTQLPSPCSATVTVVVAAAWLAIGAASACYSYPEGAGDPCASRRCSYGASCRASIDGLTARCQCPDRCDRFGDTVDAGERCGDNGRDYASDCDMRLAACRELREIRTKYLGRCGQYTPVLFELPPGKEAMQYPVSVCLSVCRFVC